MDVKSWKAEITMLVNQGTDTARQTFAVEGGGCKPDELPAQIAKNIEAIQRLLSDKTREQKEIGTLTEKLHAANKQVELMREADQAQKERAASAKKAPGAGEGGDSPPAQDPAPELPVKRGKFRK